MRIWRISNHADLSGRGGLLADGRWHRKGQPILYCADHPSTALLETIVHTTREAIPDTFQLIEIDTANLPVAEATPPHGWQADPATTQELGRRFLQERKAPLLRVPSVIMPKAFNFIVNPLHERAAQMSIVAAYRYPFDSRLLGQG